MGSILTDDVNLKLCEDCGDCCTYVAAEIDAPESTKDHEQIMKYLFHEQVRVFVETDDDDDEETWFIEFKARCQALTDDLLCSTYQTRPNVCREYSPKTCPQNNPEDEAEEYQFNCPEDYLAWLRIKGFKGKLTLPAEITMEVRVDIDQPTNNKDHDQIAWYLLHNGVSVYNDSNNDWFIQFMTRPRGLFAPEQFKALLNDSTVVLKTEPTPVATVNHFLDRKQYLEYLKKLGAKYTLKEAKGVSRRPEALQSAIPIVHM